MKHLRFAPPERLFIVLILYLFTFISICQVRSESEGTASGTTHNENGNGGSAQGEADNSQKKKSASKEENARVELEAALGKATVKELDDSIKKAMELRSDSKRGTEADRDKAAKALVEDALIKALDSKEITNGDPTKIMEEKAKLVAKIKPLLETKYSNSFLSGEKGAFSGVFKFEPVLGKDLPKGVFMGGAGLTQMYIHNKVPGNTYNVSGHFSPIKEGDRQVKDADDFKKDGERAWRPMAFDKSDTPTANPQQFEPKPAKNPTDTVEFPSGTGLKWAKRGPGPIAILVKDSQGNIIGPDNPHVYVDIDINKQTIQILPRSKK